MDAYFEEQRKQAEELKRQPLPAYTSPGFGRRQTPPPFGLRRRPSPGKVIFGDSRSPRWGLNQPDAPDPEPDAADIKMEDLGLSPIRQMEEAKEEIKERVVQLVEEKKVNIDEREMLEITTREMDDILQREEAALNYVADQQQQVRMAMQKLPEPEKKSKEAELAAELKRAGKRIRKLRAQRDTAKGRMIYLESQNTYLNDKEGKLLLDINTLQAQVGRESEVNSRLRSENKEELAKANQENDEYKTYLRNQYTGLLQQADLNVQTLAREKTSIEAQYQQAEARNAERQAGLEAELLATKSRIQTLQQQQRQNPTQQPLRPYNKLLGRRPSVDSGLALQDETKRLASKVRRLESERSNLRTQRDKIQTEAEAERLKYFNEIAQAEVDAKLQTKQIELLEQRLREQPQVLAPRAPRVFAVPDDSTVLESRTPRAFNVPADDSSFVDEWSDQSQNDLKLLALQQELDTAKRQVDLFMSRDASNARKYAEMEQRNVEFANREARLIQEEKRATDQNRRAVSQLQLDTVEEIARFAAANDKLTMEKQSLMFDVKRLEEGEQLSRAEEQKLLSRIAALQAKSEDLEAQLRKFTERVANTPSLSPGGSSMEIDMANLSLASDSPSVIIYRSPGEAPVAVSPGMPTPEVSPIQNTILQSPYLLRGPAADDSTISLEKTPEARRQLTFSPATVEEIDSPPVRQLIESPGSPPSPELIISPESKQRRVTFQQLLEANKLIGTYYSKRTNTALALESLPSKFPRFVKNLTAMVARNRPELNADEVKQETTRIYLNNIRYAGTVVPRNKPTLAEMQDILYPPVRTSPVTTRAQRIVRLRAFRVQP